MKTFQINETNLAPTIDDLKTIYSSMLLDSSVGSLEKQKTHYHIKRAYELAAEKDIQNLWFQSLENAYQVFFKKYPQYAKISAHYKFFYCPSKNVLEGKYRYILGADPHLYGWNLVGKVLEKHFYGWKPKFNKYWVYYVHHALNYLYSYLLKGEDISIYNGLTPVEILKKMRMTAFPFRECLDWELNYQLGSIGGKALWVEPHLVEQGTCKHRMATLLPS